MSARGKVVVAMSGGVDSSVAAAILLEAGWEVLGATLDWRGPKGAGDEGGCGRDAVDRAREVARQLGMEHRVVRCGDDFERLVLRPAWEEYARGRTPSPCVHCNRMIKLRLMARLAAEVGADRIATGHFARMAPGGVLRRGADRSKDQSYFLFALTEEQRRSALFPLGEMDKEEVRERASRLDLASADAPESQDACFGDGDLGFAEALRRRFGAAARGGEVLDRDGEHGGIHLFTVGQRKGLGIATGRRAYVSMIDPATARVVLTGAPADLESDRLRASGFVWHGDPPAGPVRCGAQVRYRSSPADAEAVPDGRGVSVLFDSPQRAVAPGQAVVLYDGDRVLGGGWIDSTK